MKFTATQACIVLGRRIDPRDGPVDLPFSEENHPKHLMPVYDASPMQMAEEEKAKIIVSKFDSLEKEAFRKYLKTLDPQFVRSWPKMARDKLDRRLKEFKIRWAYRIGGRPKKTEKEKASGSPVQTENAAITSSSTDAQT